MSGMRTILDLWSFLPLRVYVLGITTLFLITLVVALCEHKRERKQEHALEITKPLPCLVGKHSLDRSADQ